ncbi:MAG: hypothetical protein ONB44_06445 [candidate division KSB1 bacterium]|nr:hypothetical protein [candidate division KSB1 bacterium]MDZ7301762.1 hypothetical protein [candidate division KSB1 bacterium]MDZ7311459.1 hypothetical protein [candidate division KSB1 bacterium]
MKAILALFIFWFTATPVAQAQFNPANLVPEILHYRMLSGSIKVGRAVIEIRHDSIAGIIHIAESIFGLFEQTTVLTLREDSTLQTRTSHTVLSRDNQYQEAQLKYNANGTRVSGEARRPSEVGAAA